MSHYGCSIQFLVKLVSEMYYYYYIYSKMAKKWCAIRLTFPSSKTKQSKRKFCSIMNAIRWILCGWRYWLRFYQWTFCAAFRHAEHHYYVTLWAMLLCYTFIHWYTQNTTSLWQHFPSNLSCIHLKIYSNSIQAPNADYKKYMFIKNEAKFTSCQLLVIYKLSAWWNNQVFAHS